eukprot:TRINITY_DN25542_c0_g1_i1.p1 TRINITY_DN25542_c0_g1~~TRINITY_DN25542_c0_g1_i1.p1  ORF type:complete len:166 (-),score=3.06 TRINITY_DN25542_c0_g1_i1:126-569(-)
MAFITLIVDGYCRWNAVNDGGKFFEREYEFYLNCGLALTSLLVYILTVLLILAVYHLITPYTKDLAKINYSTLIVGLLLSYCSRFVELGALLWGTPETQFLWFFVDLLYLLTSINALKVVSGLNSLQSTTVAIVAHTALHLVEFSPF